MNTKDKPRGSILVADDNADLVLLLCSLCEQNGLDAKGVTDSEELLEALHAVEYDIILLDVHLGKADGRDLTLEIREDERYRQARIILMSGKFVDDVAVERCGADAFLAKPFGLEDFLAVVGNK